jgi:hypothetical protein
MHAGRWFVAALLVTALAVTLYVRLLPTTGSIVWKADAERPAAEEWASSRADPPGPAPCPAAAPPDLSTPRIRRSTAVVAQGRYSYAITTAHGDRCDGERTELGQDNPSRPGFTEGHLFRSGEDRYISFQVLLARNFDVNVRTWRVITQLHLPGSGLGTPPLSLDVESGRFVLYKSDANVDSNGTIPLWSGPARNDRWVKFTLHLKFSADPAVGFVELWGNPADGPVVALLPKTHTYTMKRDASGAEPPLHARIGIYRNPAGPFGTETAYYDGFTVATTRAAAEGNAFSQAGGG